MRRLRDSLLLAILIWSVGLSLCSTVFAESGNPTIVINNPDTYAWAAKGSQLAYATSDGIVWSLHGPDFAKPIRIIKIELPKEQKIEQIVWSSNEQTLAFVSPRLTDGWDTIWLVNLKTLKLRDLLPLGAPFGSPGTRALRISSWLPDGRIAFVLHCGTGCVGLHAVQTNGKEEYWDFCNASGDFFWSPDYRVAAIQNNAEGVGAVGLGLVVASGGATVAKDASYYHDRRDCQSIFKGGEPPGPQQISPHFNSWFPDSTRALYTDSGLSSSDLKIWDTDSGSRNTLVANASSGTVSPDGNYVSYISPKHGTAIWSSNRVRLFIMDLRSKKIIASSEIPAIEPPLQWSPSMSHLAILLKNSQLLVARLGSNGIHLRRMGIKGKDLSWSPDGRYLAVRSVWDEPSRLKIVRIQLIN
jgi:Anaphase-promoting complex subunit 4 WD40 domain